MRIAILFVIAALLAGVSYFLFGRDGRLPDGAAAPVPKSAPSEVLPDLSGSGDAVPKGVRAEATEAAVASADPEAGVAAGVAPAADRLQVTGRILDQDGAPLAGTRVQLGGYQWPVDRGVPVLDRLAGATYTREQLGFETQAGDDGFFSIEAPLFEGMRHWLLIAPDQYHDSHRVSFGRGGEPPLATGVRDVGEIRLAERGAIFGQVTDARGQPLGNVKMSTGPGRSRTYGRGTLTGADGRYLIPHAEVGTYMVKAKIEGYVSGMEEGVTVAPGQPTGPVDLVLEDAPWIRGRVVAESGEPVQGARLYGWPSSSGSGAGTRTDEKGEFTVYLPQAEPYSMGLSHPDFESWGDEYDKETLFDPGTDLGTLTLKRAARVRFRAVDSLSGEAITAFGVSIEKNRGSGAVTNTYSSPRPPKVEPQEGGYLELAATAKVDLYTAIAEGYLVQTGDVEPTEESLREGLPTQVIELRPGAAVVGRVVRGGKPLRGLAVELLPGSEHRGEFCPNNELVQVVKTGSDGRFRCNGLTPHMAHRLTVTADRGAPLVLSRLKFKMGEDNDLGDLELVQGGSVAGQVILPAGLDPSGLTVYRGNWREDIVQTTDSEGRFRFDDVPAGEHSFTQAGRPGEIESGGKAQVVVASGETAEVTLDVRDLGLVQVAITVEFGGEPVEGVSVTVMEQVAAAFESTAERGGQAKLGDTDATGTARGTCRGFGDASVRVQIPGGGVLTQDDPALQITYGLPVTATVGFDLASMKVKLPAVAQLPDEGRLSIILKAEPAPGSRVSGIRQVLRVPIVNGRLDTGGSAFQSVEGETLTLAGLGAGTFAVELFAQAKDAPEVRVQLSDVSWRSGRERTFEFEGQVTLVPGTTAVLELD